MSPEHAGISIVARDSPSLPVGQSNSSRMDCPAPSSLQEMRRLVLVVTDEIRREDFVLERLP